jgi:hypothetical protein
VFADLPLRMTITQLGPAKENNDALEPPKRYRVSGCCDLKRKFRLKTSSVDPKVSIINQRQCWGRGSEKNALVSTREHPTFTAARPLTPFTAVAMAAVEHATANQRGGVLLRSLALFLELVFVSNVAAQTRVTTYHNDAQRTGWNSHESILNQVNVAPNSFGWLFTVSLARVSGLLR